ncbi:serine/threonine-protein kinase [Thermopolyspora flexuosa]|uniref:Serine/threonine protein kinase n=1 Tax=Thermopolyspora flexuosa TaxID=103836 RepID=A0A543ISN0_9ACTN|nr:serine/threonine-protein kinase [Thermopolyspora flexuosa]TQM73580.1 serine/threonine protein kinase [Thermopolyspora flexuosa]
MDGKGTPIDGHDSTAQPLRPDDPERLGPYRLRGRLGEGGMGTVYLAGDENGRPVAVKIVREVHTRREGFAERFHAEVMSARRVSSFCTSRVLDDGVAEDGRPYLVTEYIPGISLAERIRRSGPLDSGSLHGVAFGVAAALAAIHAAGVVHLDLKPANVILSPLGPRIIDFGVARALDDPSGEGVLVGTPGWWAPEQVAGGEVTSAADIFAWGCLVAYAGTGRHPFGEGDAEIMAERVRTADPEIGPLPPPLDHLVRRALDRDPDRRPTARDLLLRLVEPGDAAPAAEGPALPAAAPPPGTRPVAPDITNTDPGPNWLRGAAAANGYADAPAIGLPDRPPSPSGYGVPDPAEGDLGAGTAGPAPDMALTAGAAGARRAAPSAAMAAAGRAVPAEGAPAAAVTPPPAEAAGTTDAAAGREAEPDGDPGAGEDEGKPARSGPGRGLRAARAALLVTLAVTVTLMVASRIDHNERPDSLDVLDKPARVTDVGRRIPLAATYHGPQLVVEKPECGYRNHTGGVLNPDRQTCRIRMTLVNMGPDEAPLAGELPILVDDLGQRHRPYYPGQVPTTIAPGARLMLTVSYGLANTAFPRMLVGRFVPGGETIRVRL